MKRLMCCTLLKAFLPLRRKSVFCCCHLPAATAPCFACNAPELTADELAELGVDDSHQLCYYVMCVVKSPVANSTLNLKCPVVINDETLQAMQVILENDDYGMRHLLSEFAAAEGAEKC